MDRNLIFSQICDIIRRNRGLQKKSLINSTTLQRDLGVDGDDADEIMSEYFSTFDVDGSQFDFDDYFGTEVFNPFLFTFLSEEKGGNIYWPLS